jgi:hypothetical protein
LFFWVYQSTKQTQNKAPVKSIPSGSFYSKVKSDKAIPACIFVSPLHFTGFISTRIKILFIYAAYIGPPIPSKET